jgi:lipopolysaccharide export system ATP-binding protein
MTALSVNNLYKSYRGRKVVDKVSIKIEGGEVVGLLGPNGAGKTTCFYMIVGLIQMDSGTIHLGDNDISKLPMHQRAKMGVSYLPQEPSAFRRLTVEQNIMAILETRKDLSKQQRGQRLEDLLHDLHIEERRNTLAQALSGGERRRTEIARALATDPKFILLDEPFAGVDPVSVIEIQQLIKHLQSKSIGVLITDHNVREILRICDRAYILNDGQILTAGSAEAVLANQTVREVYLGQDFRL